MVQDVIDEMKTRATSIRSQNGDISDTLLRYALKIEAALQQASPELRCDVGQRKCSPDFSGTAHDCGTHPGGKFPSEAVAKAGG